MREGIGGGRQAGSIGVDWDQHQHHLTHYFVVPCVVLGTRRIYAVLRSPSSHRLSLLLHFSWSPSGLVAGNGDCHHGDPDQNTNTNRNTTQLTKLAVTNKIFFQFYRFSTAQTSEQTQQQQQQQQQQRLTTATHC